MLKELGKKYANVTRDSIELFNVHWLSA
jgi:hypothetical protein